MAHFGVWQSDRSGSVGMFGLDREVVCVVQVHYPLCRSRSLIHLNSYKSLTPPLFMLGTLFVSKTSINVSLTDQGKCHLSNLRL